jgi:bacillithiol biosynthesis deacetylase BshB1
MPADLCEPLDVIAVGAHPDDVEIGCGGTLARLIEQGYRVGIVDLTDGEPTPGSPGPHVRLEEAREAARILGVHERVTLDFTNRRLFDGFDERVALAKVFRRFRPQLVMGIADRTPTASPDHWQARQIIDAAVFYSRLTKWDASFDGLPPHTVRKQLWYALGLTSIAQPQGKGQFVVDISRTLPIKLKAVTAYKTQFEHRQERISRLIEAQAHYFGAGAGFDAGEMYAATSAIGVDDLMQTICPPLL